MFSFLKIESLGARIIAINLIGLILLAIGFILVDKSENNLIEARKEALILQANLIAFSFTLDSSVTNQEINNIDNLFLTKKWTSTKIARTQIFNDNLIKIFDSKDYQKEKNQDQDSSNYFFSDIIKIIKELFGRDAPLLPDLGYSLSDLKDAILGKTKATEYKLKNGGITVHVSIPLQRNNLKKEVLLLSTQEGDIGRIIREERQRYLRAFLVALSISLFLSVSLSSTIARPLNRLAKAAEGVSNAGIGEIPIMENRKDEIGVLANSVKRMTIALQDRVKSVEAFAADVAHELKNPLTSLQSAIETLQLSKEEEERKQLIKIAIKDLKRLDRLISDISSSSRLEVELARGEFEVIDIRDVLQSVMEVTRTNITKKIDIKINLKLPKNKIEVLGIGDRIAQVFYNLIDNAISFSKAGYNIDINASTTKSDAIIEIRDEGPGIPKENLGRIFERFYTYRPEEKIFGNNSGLGLSICKQIIKSLNGTIIATNRLGGGAVFTIILPLNKERK
jgi:two-component system sensor histidine kinase ChvG